MNSTNLTPSANKNKVWQPQFSPAQDPLSVLEALDTSRQLIGQESKKYREQLLRRAKYIEAKIGATTDPERLKGLHEGKMFLEQTARELDTRDVFLDRLFTWLRQVDRSYWETMKGGEMIKEVVQANAIRCGIFEDKIRKLLAQKRQWQREGAQA